MKWIQNQKIVSIGKNRTGNGLSQINFSDDSLLMFGNGSDKYSIDDYFPTENGKSGWWYRTKVKIPKNLECEHCVLQWRYHTGTFARWFN